MGARLKWRENLDMVALLEKVYEHYSSVKYPRARQPMLMELKWAAAFTFDQLRGCIKPEFGMNVPYEDRTYSAFCQIDMRFRMRKGFGDEDRADVREAERQAARYWRTVTESVFYSPYSEDWPPVERSIYLADKERRNAAAARSNADRRIADDKKVKVKETTSRLYTTTLLGLPVLAANLLAKFGTDPLVSVRIES